MSRIGKQPVDIPKDVTVTVNDNHVIVKGPKGTLERDFPNLVNISVEDNKVVVTRNSDDKEARAMHGTTRALIQNMVKGVSTGYEKSLEIVGVGYRVAKQGKKIVLTVGYSHPVEIEEERALNLQLMVQIRLP